MISFKFKRWELFLW